MTRPENPATPDPCPFCGGKAITLGGPPGSARMTCGTCGAMGPVGPLRVTSLGRWNQRAHAPAVFTALSRAERFAVACIEAAELTPEGGENPADVAEAIYAAIPFDPEAQTMRQIISLTEHPAGADDPMPCLEVKYRYGRMLGGQPQWEDHVTTERVTDPEVIRAYVMAAKTRADAVLIGEPRA